MYLMRSLVSHTLSVRRVWLANYFVLAMPRKKPFSHKQKKLQLQQKREKKRDREKAHPQSPSSSSNESESESETEQQQRAQPPTEPPLSLAKLNQQPVASSSVSKYDPNRYRLHFERESKKEIERRKKEAKTLPIIPAPEVEMEVGVEDIYRPSSMLDIPKRPPWSHTMSKVQVERQEEAMFERFLKEVYSRHRPEEISFFEHNLETWRQLWRVLEISDVVLLITDIRHPALHFPPALYRYVVEDLKKKVVLVLNKVDLVPPQVAVAWRHYFLSRFPQLTVICFTCYPNTQASLQPSKKVSLKFRRRVCGRFPSAVGPRELFRVIEAMYRGQVDFAGWQQKLEDSSTDGCQATETIDCGSDGDSEVDSEEEEPVAITTTSMTSSPLACDEVREGVLTIGMVGHPNVGKSSILNGLMEKKMVSTSRTPGHTKHFQTIFLSHSIRLCDCPGLVFPSLINKQLQILSGMYPIAQVREPYTAVGYLAERVPLVDLLRLEHPDHEPSPKPPPKDLEGGSSLLDFSAHDGSGDVWTAWDICDAWADKRGYFTSKAARYDSYRAANSLLRLAVDGRVNLFFRPPGYTKEKANWECHPEVSEMIELQRRGLTTQGANSRPIHPSPRASGEREEEGPGAKRGGQKLRTEGNKFALLMEMDDTDL